MRSKCKRGQIPTINGKAILLIGKADQRFMVPSEKDQREKHLFSYGSQLYSYWPYQGQRCIVTYHGRYIGEHNIIVYGEDCIHPHIERTWPDIVRRKIGNTRARFEATIKEERAGNYKNPQKTAGNLLSNPIFKKWWPQILVGMVVIFAFIYSGGKI